MSNEMPDASGLRPPKVFISYSHDSPEHRDRVLDLANQLRSDGVDARCDQYETSPPEGWQRWMERQVRDADFVLMICSMAYRRRADGEEEPGKGLGVTWEGKLIGQYLYEAGAVNKKFIPVLLANCCHEDIPVAVRGTSYFDLTTATGYEDLYRLITNQPRALIPQLGKLRRLSPRARRSIEPPKDTTERRRASPEPAPKMPTQVARKAAASSVSKPPPECRHPEAEPAMWPWRSSTIAVSGVLVAAAVAVATAVVRDPKPPGKSQSVEVRVYAGEFSRENIACSRMGILSERLTAR